MHFNSASVRCISLEGQPYFIAADICKILGILNCTTAVKNLRDDECRMVSLFGAPERHSLSVKGIQKKLSRSHKQEAKALLEWIEREAIPAYCEAAQAEKLAKPDAVQLVQRLAARVDQLERQLSALA
jgi:prophage antirepressor-like protein